MGLFSKYNKIEKELLETYSQTFSSIGMPDPKKSARESLDKAIEDSKKQRTYDLPPNMGDIILGKAIAEDKKAEKISAYMQKHLSAKRKDGVKDEDILWCWNLYDVERFLMLTVDEFHRMVLFIEVLKETDSADEAGKQVWKFHPSYTMGDPKNEKPSIKGHTEKDLPLPIELKDRVNIYIEKMNQNPSKIKKDIELSSSFNALVRKEIKNGNI